MYKAKVQLSREIDKWVTEIFRHPRSGKYLLSLGS